MSEQVFHVAPAGQDAWSGVSATPNGTQTDGPWRTLVGARDGLRAWRAIHGWPADGVTILVHAGLYPQTATLTFEAQDSGLPGAPLRLAATGDGPVVLSGGLAVPPAAWTPVSEPEILARLAPAARARVLQVDLHALGLGELQPLPVRFQGAPLLPELLWNGQRQTLARWPDRGWATIERIVAPGATPRTGDTDTSGGIFTVANERIARWQSAAGVWLHGYFCYDWYAEIIQVAAIEPSQRQLTMAAPAHYGIRAGNPSPRRFYALNLLEELDQPGEYVIDAARARLYCWPPTPVAGATVTLARLKAPLLALTECRHLEMRGLTLEASLADGLTITGGQAVQVLGCTVRLCREQAIVVEGGHGHRVQSCDLHDTGTGGLSLSGGDRRTLSPGGHEACNNHIWRFACHKLTYSNALTLSGVGLRAAHNLIHDAPHQAVSLVGNDHVFEYNEVHHVCLATDDCGALYKGRNPSCRGNLIRHNFWYQIGSPMGHGNAAVYFDDGDGGDTVIGNLFYHCGSKGKAGFGTVFCHGGHDHLATENIFIDCERALGSAPWSDARWLSAVQGGEDCFWTQKLLQEVDITQPPYTTRYPELRGFMEPQPGQPRVSRAQRNVFWRCELLSSGNWQVPEPDNWRSTEDPGFVNAATGDFRLRPDAALRRHLPGFSDLPFAQMGLQPDAYRPIVPPRPWPPAPIAGG